MSALQEILEDYDAWARRTSLQGKPATPAEFMKSRHVERILLGLRNMLRDDRDDRYPLEEYLEDDDIEWIESQGSTEVALD